VNTIKGPYTAIINDRPTGLAGCANHAQCLLGERCLRADPRLELRIHFTPEGCRVYIPVTEDNERD